MGGRGESFFLRFFLDARGLGGGGGELIQSCGDLSFLVFSLFSTFFPNAAANVSRRLFGLVLVAWGSMGGIKDGHFAVRRLGIGDVCAAIAQGPGL